MNMSNKYKAAFDHFIREPARVMHWPTINDLDSGNVFCYLKGTPLLVPSMMTPPAPFGPLFDKVIPLIPGNYPTCTIQKAEAILYSLSPLLKRFALDNNVYYASWGHIFNMNKTPLLITCMSTTSQVNTYPVICIDYSVFENQDEPMHRFIMRKFVPSLIEKKRSERNTRIINYTFMNCKSFVVKPTFQGELDHKLVADYLAERIQYEFR